MRLIGLLGLFTLVILTFPCGAVADSLWPPMPQGEAYASPPPVPAPSPAATKKAPLTNDKGATVVFFVPGSEGLEAIIDSIYASGGEFAQDWDELVNSGDTMQLQWWKFGGKYNGAHAEFDPKRAGHTISIAVDPNDARGNPYPYGILESNIVRGFLMAEVEWSMYKHFVH